MSSKLQNLKYHPEQPRLMNTQTAIDPLQNSTGFLQPHSVAYQLSDLSGIPAIVFYIAKGISSLASRCIVARVWQ